MSLVRFEFPKLVRLLLGFVLFSVGSNCLADAAKIAGTIEATVEGRVVRFPSLATRVDVDVQGDLAKVRVTQTFENPLQQPVHARYLFPLNKNAAVFGLTMNVGNERVRATIKKKVEAEKTFVAAKKEGKAAVLLTQHRPNMFTQRIANLMPGLPIEIVMQYSQTVPKIDGAYELVVPLVVGPRFDPGHSADRQNSVESTVSKNLNSALNTLPLSSPVVGVDLPSSVDANRVAMAVRLESAIGFSSITSATHAVNKATESASVVRVSLSTGAVIANRDFVLRYQLGEASDVTSGMLSYADERGGFFSLMIEPPERWQSDQVLPREMVFLLDCSGSMSGAPMDASKAFMRAALSELRPNDSFRIIRFSDHATEFSRSPMSATAANIAAGLRYTQALQGSGGTVMRSGVEQALMVPKTPGYVRNVIFLTDGYIGNEFEILGLVGRELGQARLFALGVGSGVNRYLLDELARTGRGFARYLDATNVEERAIQLAQRLQTPLLTDISIDWGDIEPTEITPSKLPDLYAGDSLRLQGRYTSSGQFPITVRGRQGDSVIELPITVTLAEAVSADSQKLKGQAIALIWARSAVKDAMHQLSVPQQLRKDERSESSIVEQVTQLGLDYSLVTRWTSFVAVSEQIVNPNPDLTAEVAIPVAKVAGVSPHGGYAAPEPGTWLGFALLVLMILFFLGAPRPFSSVAQRQNGRAYGCAGY